MIYFFDVVGKCKGSTSRDDATDSEIQETLILRDAVHAARRSGAIDPNTHYFSDGAVIQMPPKPSSNHRFNYTTKQWEDPRTLDDLKGEKWRNIKFNRDAAEYGGFTWDGSVFDSDAISQQRIAGAVQLAQMNPAFTTVWTLADNTTRTLNAQDMFAVGLALGAHVSGVFSHGMALRAQIDASTTAQEVEAIHW